MSDSILTAPLDSKLLDVIESRLIEAPQMEIKYQHLFAEGVYIRVAYVKAGMIGMGHEHRQETINTLLKGKIRLLNDDQSMLELQAPAFFTSAPGVRKVAHFIEDTIFLNVLPNPTNETDIGKLEDLFVVKSENFLKHEQRAINEGKL